MIPKYPSQGEARVNKNQTKLRDVRVREGLTATALSKFSEMTERTIRDIEKGRRAGTEVTRRKILNGLNKNPDKSKVWRYEEIFGG